MDQFTKSQRDEAILRRFAACKFLDNLDDAMEHDETGDFAPAWALSSLDRAMEQLVLMRACLQAVVTKDIRQAEAEALLDNA